MRRIAIAIAGLLLLATWVHGSVLYWPGYEWKTIPTSHFRVHYHQGERDLAYRVAVIAEQVLPDITTRLGWEPKGKIEIVLSDDQDDSNGSSTPLPVNTLRLYAATPHPSSVLDDYDDWLRILLAHELTHTVHIDRVRGLPKAVRWVFGRIITPTHLSPVFEIEGLAVLHETLLSQGGGRAQSVQAEMIVRAEWGGGHFPSLDRISNWTTDFPHGARPYVIGGVFHKWVAKQYGDEVWGKVARRQSGMILPFCHNSNMKKASGVKLSKLYKAWVQSLDVRYDALNRSVKQQGLTGTVQLTKTGDRNRRPRFSADSASIFFEESTGFRKGRIRKMDFSDYEVRTVKRTGVTGDVAYFPDGRMVYAATSSDQTWKSRYKLYQTDKQGNGAAGLPGIERSRDIAASPDGRHLLFVANELERPSIGLYDMQSEQKRSLYTVGSDEDLIQFAEPAFSPDGKSVALSVWHNDGNRDIFLYSPESATFRRLTFDVERDTSPAFSPDGNYLLFVSGRTGISNIFALHLGTEKLYQVTNVFYGAFDPAVSPNQRYLAFAGYGPKGYDIHLMGYAPENWKEVPYLPLSDRGFQPCRIGRQIAQQAKQVDKETDEEDYQGWRTLLPRYWMPSLGNVEGYLSLGGQTSGHDVLMHHLYSLAALYTWQNRFLSYRLAYTNAILRPNFTFSHSRSAVYYGQVLVDEDGGFDPYWEQRTAGSASMLYPINSSHSLLFGYILQDRRRLTEIPDSTFAPIEEGIFSGLRTGWLFDDSGYYRESISPAFGSVASVTYTAFSKAFGADYEVRTLLGAYHRYFGLPIWNHVIAARATAGYAEGETLFLRAFRLGGFQNDQILAQPSENSIFLRGYNRASRRGQRVAATSLEYRLPLWRIQRGIGTFPVFLNRLSMIAFSDVGTAWNKTYQDEDILSSAGGELHLLSHIIYYYPVQVRLGGAWGFFDPDLIGGFHWIFTFGGSF